MSAMRHGHDMTLLITTESLAFGTFVVDDTHRIVSWNEAASRSLGYDAETTLGRSCEEMLTLLHAQDAPVCRDISDTSDTSQEHHAPRLNLHALKQRENEPVQLRVITQHGEQRWIRVSIIRARTLDGAMCVLHAFRDVTDQQEGEAEAVAQMSRHPGIIVRLPSESPESVGTGPLLSMSPEHLTPREHEVLDLLAQGMATVEIAAALGISRVTARNHVTRVIEKLGVKTRLQAVLAASRLGLV